MKLRKLLKSLGSPDEIAKWFRRCHIKGIPNNQQLCPVGIMLTRMKLITTSVDADEIITFMFGNIERKVVKTPKNIRNFIKKFDSGAYPDLITDYFKLKEIELKASTPAET
jgi:hypothetical protein